MLIVYYSTHYLLKYTLKNFASGESDAVTVDWVALTAADVELGLVIMAATRPAVNTLSGSIANAITDATPSAGEAGGGSGGGD